MQPAGADACILIVDDDLIVTDILEVTLACAGWANVIATNDPTQVAGLVEVHRPHVILLDRHMAGIDGLAVLRSLNDLRVEIGISILMLTADTDERVAVEALECGAQDFIVKPFRPPELLARVAVAVEVQQLRRLLLDRNASLEAAVQSRTARLEAAVAVLKAAEAKLQETLAGAEAERYRLIAETAHELRTPLNGVLGYAQFISNQISGPVAPPVYRDYAERIAGAGRHMAALIDRLLELAQASSGVVPPDIEPVNLPALVSEAISLLMPLAAEGGIALTLVVKPGVDTIETDPVKLRQIVLNLTSNALKFTPAGGKVAVEIGPDPAGGAYILIVRDNGIGIRPDDLDRIMKPFAQIASAQPGRKKGTGLGMPLTKLFVEQLGGTLQIESEFDSGTTVTVHLPFRAGASTDGS